MNKLYKLTDLALSELDETTSKLIDFGDIQTVFVRSYNGIEYFNLTKRPNEDIHRLVIYNNNPLIEIVKASLTKGEFIIFMTIYTRKILPHFHELIDPNKITNINVIEIGNKRILIYIS
jgi:hypothetical protein